ncbi:MAG: hypothetical protein PVI21_05345 [Candidatus Woesebacteria bacterium]|jgi:hypothetical protein
MSMRDAFRAIGVNDDSSFACSGLVNFDKACEYVQAAIDDADRDEREQHVLASCYAWRYYARFGDEGCARPTCAITSKIAHAMDDLEILWLAAQLGNCTRNSTDHACVRQEVARRWSPSQNGRVVIVDGRYVIYKSGRVRDCEWQRSFFLPIAYGELSLVPNEAGWLSFGPRVSDRDGRREAHWYGPEVYHAKKLLASHHSGAVYLSPGLVRCYGKSNKGHPRFVVGAQDSLGCRKSFELPVWRPDCNTRSVTKSWLMEHLDAIRVLTGAGIEVPPSAYWVNVRLYTSRSGRVYLKQSGRRKYTAALVCKDISGALGRRARGNNDVRLVEVLEGDTQVLWSNISLTTASVVLSLLAWIPRDGVVAFKDGSCLTFDGRAIFQSRALPQN